MTSHDELVNQAHIEILTVPLPSMTMNPNLESDSKSSCSTSVWNLLSHRYKLVLIGLCGSKSNDTFFSFPSSVKIVPTNSTRPFGGTRLYSLSFCCVEVMAANTDRRFTRDLILEAVPYSCVNMVENCEICDFGGMTRLIIEVPAPRAESSCLMSLRIFHSWMFCSAASGTGADIVEECLLVVGWSERGSFLSVGGYSSPFVSTTRCSLCNTLFQRRQPIPPITIFFVRVIQKRRGGLDSPPSATATYFLPWLLSAREFHLPFTAYAVGINVQVSPSHFLDAIFALHWIRGVTAKRRTSAGEP